MKKFQGFQEKNINNLSKISEKKRQDICTKMTEQMETISRKVLKCDVENYKKNRLIKNFQEALVLR